MEKITGTAVDCPLCFTCGTKIAPPAPATSARAAAAPAAVADNMERASGVPHQALPSLLRNTPRRSRFQCRNTRQIHEAFGPLAPSRMYASGGDGPAVRFVPASPQDAIGVADDEVDALLEAGWRPENVCLLTTGHRHPVQIERTDFHDQDGYWKTFWDTDDVFYGHVLGCKGLERRAVVLCVNEREARDRARERLYVGMSRATDELVVVGDPAMVRAIAGDQVAHRLGI